MRYMFGLVGVLVTVAIIVLVMSMYLDKTKGIVGPANKAANQAQQFAGVQKQGLAGINQPGMRSADSITFAEEMSGSRFKGLRVTSVVVGGPMEDHFGLMTNDVILEINGMKVPDFSINDPELAKAQALEAYQRNHTLTVDRGGLKIELPKQRGVLPPTPTPGSPAAQSPGSPAADGNSPLQDQLNVIQSIPTH